MKVPEDPTRTEHIFEPARDKTYNNTCVTSEDSDQPVHPPSMAKLLIYPSFGSLSSVDGTRDQRTDQAAHAQADLSIRWSHKSNCMFCLSLAHL